MIDWLDFTIELQHPTIEQGSFVLFDHTGEITHGSDIRRNVSGSYDSSIQVSSTSSMPFYSDAMLELGLYKGIDDGFFSVFCDFFLWQSHKIFTGS